MTSLFALTWHTPLMTIGLGNVVAGILAWKRNEDILWTLLGFLFGWFYVIYWFFTRDKYKGD